MYTFLCFYLVKGRPFEVKQLFLEDILRTTGYSNKDMRKYKKEIQRGNYQPLVIHCFFDFHFDVQCLPE